MASIKRGINYLLHNRWQFVDSVTTNYLQWLPDKLYLSIRYRAQMGKCIDWKNPKTFNEKINWLKIYNRKPEYTVMVDKYEVKEYVAKKIGREYIIPTIGVWDRPEDIEWEKLPNQFVLKTTNGGGGLAVIICKDKSNFDVEVATRKLNNSLKFDLYKDKREWPYKNVKSRIIAEQFMSSDTRHKNELKDYKFFCFNGKVKCLKVDFDRFQNHRANYYSPEGDILLFGEKHFLPDFEHNEHLPDNLNMMIEIAETLSEGHPFLRVDLYNILGRIYFGELTFSPAGGMGQFTDDKWDYKFGEWLKLPERTNN